MRYLLAIIVILMVSTGSFQADKFSSARNKMVESQIESRGISDPGTLRAMRKVPRHMFVPKTLEADAYGDFPLPIGGGQTISQPYIVAYMTEMVRPASKKKALEIGTGSGYQAAVLAEIIDSVYTIEIVPELARQSSSLLRSLGYTNIIVKAGDGYNGWKEHAPFDIIIVTAAAENIPEPLIDQLAENGRLIIPVGAAGSVQELILLIKKGAKIERRQLTLVRFVPFKRSVN